MMDTHYSILGCSDGSSFEEIKKRYQELALKYHPDKAIISNEQDREKFVLINQAWNVLREPDTRLKYDAELKHLESISNPLIYSTVEVRDLEYDKECNIYFYPCRCGSVYNIHKDELSPPEYLLECNDCSFCLLIKV
ncbi:dnaJ homolog subfamily C member 24-like [Arctopsyche grandis]|uniref:dnaJ homolog subfamily C member 24-like n=1 Tax=Arctopsyche grandis TaxID=121162 RepID=UPI00406D9E59